MKLLALTLAIVASLAFGLAFVAVAQDVAPSDGSVLVGYPVFAKDGTEVGEVAAQSPELDQGKPMSITVSAASNLGIGERTFTVSQDNYVGLQGAVTLELMSDEIDQLADPAP